MLGKLFKYEFKATSRKLLPLYGALIVFTLINRVINLFEKVPMSYKVLEYILDILKVISIIIQVVSIIGVFVVTLYIILERFYKSLYSDEGYLTFTLPIKPWKHILVKLLSSVVWTIASAVIGITSLIINFYDGNIFKDIPKYYEMMAMEIRVDLGINIESFIFALILLFLIELITGILMIYLSISLGQIFSSKHKILASFGSYLVINTIVQVLAFAALLVISLTDVEQWLTTNSYSNAFSIIVTFALVVYAILAIIYWTATDYIINHKLNLE